MLNERGNLDMCTDKRDPAKRLFYGTVDSADLRQTDELAVKEVAAPSATEGNAMSAIEVADDIDSKHTGNKNLLFCVHGYGIVDSDSRLVKLADLYDSYSVRASLLLYSWPDGDGKDVRYTSSSLRSEVWEANKCGIDLYDSAKAILKSLKAKGWNNVLFVQSYGHHVLNGLLQAASADTNVGPLFSNCFMAASEAPSAAITSPGNKYINAETKNDNGGTERIVYDYSPLKSILDDNCTPTVFVDKLDGVLKLAKTLYEGRKKRMGLHGIGNVDGYEEIAVTDWLNAHFPPVRPRHGWLRPMVRPGDIKPRHSYWNNNANVVAIVKQILTD